MDGLILVHKPQDCTSHDIVLHLRRLLSAKKVGHFGTLDPLATGLLMVGVGRATRLFPFFSKLDKAYIGKMRLGFATDTYDATGKPLSAVSCSYPYRKTVIEKIASRQGNIAQVPPPFSAKKHKGKPLYVSARRDKPIHLPPSQVTVYKFRLLDYKPPLIDFSVKCSSGTYIRSLVHDLGESLGCGAHLTHLCRTEIGPFTLDACRTLEQIQADFQTGQIEKFLQPIEALLPELPKFILTEEGTRLARHGNTIKAADLQDIPLPATAWDENEHSDSVIRLFSREGRLVALARKDRAKGGLHPFLVIDTHSRKK